MKTAEVTLYRCYWPPAFDYLKESGISDFVAKAYDLLMTLEVATEHAYTIAASLPTGAVIDVVPVSEPLQAQEIDDLLFYGQAVTPVGFDKN